MLGPFSAPSSPPETPVPMYSRPFDFDVLACGARCRRKCVLPPSMITSPGESSGISCSMSSSTAGPALTISITLRGAARLLDQLFERVAADEVLALGRGRR